MAEFTVDGTTAQEIITTEAASRVLDEEHDAQGFTVSVESSAIRLIDGDNKDQARHGEPLEVGDVFTFDPNGLSWYVIRDPDDTGNATVNVHMAKYKPINRSSL